MNKTNTVVDELNKIYKERSTSYGTPEDNFNRVASLWQSYLNGKEQGEITALDVAHMMILFKIGRTMGGANKVDNYVDIAGYAVCAAEIYENTDKAGNTTNTPI